MVAESTLAALFRCNDGAVLCADTQLTVPNHFKYAESKIKIYKGLKYRPFFAYAGDADYAKMCIDKIARRLWEEGQKGEEGSLPVETLKAAAIELHGQYYDLYKYGERDLSLCVLGVLQNRAATRVHLFKVLGPTVTPVTSYECVGSGASICRSVVEPIFFSSLPVRMVAYVAAYAIDQAKRYADGVGNQAQIVMIYSGEYGSHPVPYDILKKADTEVLGEGYAAIRKSLSPLMLIQDIPELGNNKEFETAMQNLASLIHHHATIKAGIIGHYEDKWLESEWERQEEEARGEGSGKDEMK